MSLHVIFSLSLALSGLAAGYHGSNYSGRTVISQDIPQDLIITLERTVCFGFCPVYKLTITADGVVVFEGRRFVKQEGATIRSAISKERLKQLMAEFDRVRFFSLETNYSNDLRRCMTDSPSAFTSIRINGKSKTIKHYRGCKEPKFKEITELENKIDEIVNTAQWLPDKKAR